MSRRTHTPAQVAAAWSVHVFTAMGALAGLLAIIAISDNDWMWAFFWMIITVIVDGVDGTLARCFKVKEVLPHFDGSLLDNIVDYLTFTMIPAFFIYEAGLIPLQTGFLGSIAIILASSYQFCQADAKTDDNYFKGFPSYWNVVVLYLFLLDLDPMWNLLILLVLAVLAFVPLKYIYPTRSAILRRVTITFSLIWALTLAVALLRYSADAHMPWVYASFTFVAYYVGLSLWVNRPSAGSTA